MTFKFGRDSASPEFMGLFAACGCNFGETGVGDGFIPEEDDAAWAIHKAELQEAEKKYNLKLETANGFLPGKYHICGENPDTEVLLRYAETACRRADELGVEYIMFGSGGARKIPEGFDREKGMAQFIDFCRELVKRIADCKVTILFENLRAQETNILNLLSEEQEIVELINSPKLQMMADLYHMAQMNESPESIIKAGAHLKHVHVADPNTRKWPGHTDGDLIKYFTALKKIGYNGRITFECGWPNHEEVGMESLKETTAKSFGTVNSWIEKA